ncbi:protein lifeguard 3-like [Cimex lectularius]|uniref:Uncharacterized protein n=1 Tax=Cimex lectularius TaxID=79782 RepID=A0A8I6SA09_CIMLE|nr:protein lifeguard 3-like [Cimex lectularius]
MGQNMSLDPAADEAGYKEDKFADERVRKNFVSKVYGILTLQLIFSSILIFGLTYDENIREWIFDRPWLCIIFAVSGIVVYMILACCDSVRRTAPCNSILLAVMTACYALTAATAAAQYELFVVYLAFLSTGLITIVMTLFAKFAPCDITGCGPVFCIVGLAILVFGIVASIVSIFIFAPILHLLLAGVMVVFLSLYLIFITQLIIGGKRESISPDEVILAVIILYVTIIELFMYLLAIIQACFGE